MKILSIESASGKGKLRVCLGNGTDLCLYAREVKALGISEGGELSDSSFRAIVDDILVPRAKNRALHLISRMDRTEADVRGKLSVNGYPEPVIDEVISFMKEYRYIDDLSYAKGYFRTYGRSKSLKLITGELIAKGVSRTDISAAREEAYEGDEDELVRRLIEKRHYSPETSDPKEKNRLIRFLLGKGFSYETFEAYL